MPIVQLVVGPRVEHRHQLFLAARQIVAAGLHCDGDEGSLQPGDIEFRFHELSNADYASVDIVVEVNAVGYPERRENINRRSSGMRDSFAELFPMYTFAVAVSFGLASWSSKETDDSEVVDDMSMDAAVSRARLDIEDADSDAPGDDTSTD